MRDDTTGRLVTVRGLGALKGSGLSLRKSVNLLKPIAEQAFAHRSGDDAAE